MPDELIFPAKKRKSGAQYRKEKYERIAAAVAAGQAGESPAEPKSKVVKEPKPLPPKDDGSWAEAFDRAGDIDLENPETDLSYVRKLQLISLQQMSKTPFPTLGQQELWRRIKDMSAVVGMTSSKAALEATVRKLRKQLESKQLTGTITEVHGSNIKRPPSARGGVRGPRPIPEDTPQ